jgi:hypothetical protein
VEFDFEMLRSFLTDLGATPRSLLIVAAIASIMFFFSFRALLNWYLGTQQLLEEVRVMRRQLTEVHTAMKANQTIATEKSKFEEKPVAAKPADTFRLTH